MDTHATTAAKSVPIPEMFFQSHVSLFHVKVLVPQLFGVDANGSHRKYSRFLETEYGMALTH
jgi:hypothetical protein